MEPHPMKTFVTVVIVVNALIILSALATIILSDIEYVLISMSSVAAIKSVLTFELVKLRESL